MIGAIVLGLLGVGLLVLARFKIRAAWRKRSDRLRSDTAFDAAAAVAAGCFGFAVLSMLPTSSALLTVGLVVLLLGALVALAFTVWGVAAQLREHRETKARALELDPAAAEQRMPLKTATVVTAWLAAIFGVPSTILLVIWAYERWRVHQGGTPLATSTGELTANITLGIVIALTALMLLHLAVRGIRSFIESLRKE